MKKNRPLKSGFINLRNLTVVFLCACSASLVMLSFAASPSRGTRTPVSGHGQPGLSPNAPSPGGATLTSAGQTVTYTDAGPFVTNPSHLALGTPDCTAPNSCSDFVLTVNAPSLVSTHQIVVQINWPTQANDYDTFLEDSAGNLVSANESTADPETIIAPIPGTSTVYHVIVVLAVGAPSDTITGTVSLQPIPNAVNQGPGIPPRYINYPAGQGQADDAGEPSIGVDWNPNVASLQFRDATHNLNHSGVAFFKSGSHNWRVNFDDCPSPAINLWQDVSATTDQQGVLTDPIGFVDHYSPSPLGLVYPPPHTPGRVFTLDLIGLQGNSAGAFSDDDGNTYTNGANGGAPQGGDHETLGAGPYNPNSSPAPPPHPLYANAVYYCSQNGAVEAECSRSDNGGLTFGPGVPIFPVNQCTGGIHGHVKVAPDGTVYVPNSSCGTANGGVDGVAVSTDNGLTWVENNVPNSLGSEDPSVGVGQNNVGKPAGQTTNTIYLGWISADSHPHIAHSGDRGLTWKDDIDVGSILGIKNAVFPVVVAGDDNRAAFGFIGTTTAGGCSTNPSCQAIWHLYIATTYNGGQPGSWILVDATPNDPVQTGDICLGGLGCNISGLNSRNLADFNDFSVDAEGRGVLGYADGCVNCTNTFTGQSTSSHGTVARQSGGRRLFAAFDPVEPMPPAAPQQRSATNGAGGVLVEWLEPDNGGSPITGYNVYRGATSGSEAFIAHVSGNTNTKYTDTIPVTTPNVFYYVQAVNGIGEGDHCGELSLNGTGQVESACAPPFLTKGSAGAFGPAPGLPADPTNGQLTLQRIAMGEPFVNCTDESITFLIKVQNLNPTPAPNGVWRFFFHVKDTTNTDRELFVQMDTTLTPTPSFNYGYRSPAGTGSSTTQCFLSPTLGTCPVSGTFASDGTITMKLDVSQPLTFFSSTNTTTTPDFIVNIPIGTNFTAIGGETDELVGAVGTGSLRSVQKDGGTGTYTTQGNFRCANLPPIANLTANPTSGTAPLMVNFNGSASSHPLACANIASYTMTFGDGSNPVTQASPLFMHTYNNPGDYIAKLTVTDTIGQVSTNSAQVGISVNTSVPQLTGVVSTKNHGSTTSHFEVPLTLTGTRAVECRLPGQTGTAGVDYKLIFGFANSLTSVTGVSVTGTGGGTPTASGAIGVNPQQYIVNLQGINDVQYITVTLTGVHDSTGAAGDVSATLGILVGDVALPADGVVRTGDVGVVKAEVGNPVTSSNFRSDVSANGSISTGDVGVTKAAVGNKLTPSP